MFASVRLFNLLLRQRWGLLLIGIVMLGGGLIWGATSHGVTYANSQSVAYRIAMGSQSGNVYIHADGSSDYFSAFKGDFSPEITQSDIDNSNTLSFVARTDTSTLNPPLNASDGSTVNDAHKIEKLVFYDKNGNIQKTFTTAEYDANPNGFFDNEWLKAIWLVIVVLFFWRRRTLLGGMLCATVTAILFTHFVPLPQWTFARVPLFHALTVLISDQSLLIAVTKVVGYSGMVFATIALVVSSRDIELIGTMRQLHLPQPVIFFLSTVFRTLDLSLADYETIHQAQLARAINVRPRSIIKRLRDLASIAVPMVAVMIRRSSEIGDALIARGYQLNGSSTDFYETSAWHWIDSLTIVVCLGLLVLTFGPHLNLTTLLLQRGWN